MPEVIERLKPQDLMLLWPEERGWPQDIGALAILEGGAPLQVDGELQIDVARRIIASRLHLLPRFRQRMIRPRLGFGWPLWADAPSFDISDHVDVATVPPPGDERQVLETVERLRGRPFQPGRPLWSMTFLTGLDRDRVGFYMRLHHSIADGVAGVAALAAFVDATPDIQQPASPPWIPAPTPSDREILQDNLKRRLVDLKRFFAAVERPSTVDGFRRYWPTIHESFLEGLAPMTTFNRSIGSTRRLALISGDLERARDAGHRCGGKVNDVLLAAVAGGYRELMRARHERVDEITLRAFVPVSLHAAEAKSGNLDGAMVVPLPVGESDPWIRLRRIAAETAVRKRHARPQAGSLFRNVLLQRAFLALMPRQRFMNAYIANVPGPDSTLYFAGCRMIELYPVVPITANIAIGVGALSYAGQFNLTVVADRELVPDLDVFVEGTRTALETLTAGTPSEMREGVAPRHGAVRLAR